MPSGLASESDLNGASYHHSPRCHAGNRDVGIERVATLAERLAGDHMNAQPAADRHVEVARKRRASGMCLDLDFVSGKRDAVEAQPGDARDHSGPRAVFEDEAEAVLLRPQARQVSQTFSQVARKLGARAR